MCAGVEGALKEVDEVTRRQVQRASFMLHGAGRTQVGRQHVSMHECGVKAHPGGWEGNQEATVDGGWILSWMVGRGEEGMEIFLT